VKILDNCGTLDIINLGMCLVIYDDRKRTAMKEEYVKPELETKAYAQFEDVFTRCARASGCTWIDDEIPSGSEYTEHHKIKTS
jgi:hypothetical protein